MKMVGESNLPADYPFSRVPLSIRSNVCLSEDRSIISSKFSRVVEVIKVCPNLPLAKSSSNRFERPASSSLKMG